jgi:hypothetical protein
LATRGTIHGDVIGMCMTAVHQVKANGAGYVFLGSEMIPNFKPFTWAAMIPRPAKDGYVNLKTMLLICVYITHCREYFTTPLDKISLVISRILLPSNNLCNTFLHSWLLVE